MITNYAVTQKPVSRADGAQTNTNFCHFLLHAAWWLSKQHIWQLRGWEWLNPIANYYLRPTPRRAATNTLIVQYGVRPLLLPDQFQLDDTAPERSWITQGTLRCSQRLYHYWCRSHGAMTLLTHPVTVFQNSLSAPLQTKVYWEGCRERTPPLFSYRSHLKISAPQWKQQQPKEILLSRHIDKSPSTQCFNKIFICPDLTWMNF